MKVAFYTEHLSLRGTEIALFDYAKYSQHILNNESFILINAAQPEYKNPAREKFTSEFGCVYPQHSKQTIERFIDEKKIDVFYKICAGHVEELPRNCKTAIHSVFPNFSPFGNVYAYVSEWLRDYSVPGDLKEKYDFVPHIVELPAIEDDMRGNFCIPEDAVVFGYYGGNDSFDLPFVKNCIHRILNERKDIFFLFMNISPFIDHPRIRFLPGTFRLEDKVKFINTCDAMIHARSRGETFGLAIAEFSLKNKRIVTYGQSTEKCHLQILKENAIIYNNENELNNIFKNIRKETGDFNCYREFNPHTVMSKFNQVFLGTSC
jgi:hypothetical protein